LTAKEVKETLKRLYAYRTSSIFIPEYTWKDLRIDALIVDIRKRWIRGFEVKVNRGDFLRDDKWMLYSEFCSSLSVVCPENIVMPEEIKKPYGLLWIMEERYGHRLVWKKKPMNFQKRDGLAWFWTYTNVLETELLRLDREVAYIKQYQSPRGDNR
jgi:hypothetical protein